MLALAATCVVAPGCTMDQAPEGLRRTPPGPGALVRFDMFHKPLPDIPLPNDIATWPDPTSRTGLRLNASLVASTEIEQTARRKFSEMEGWGTFGGITIGFDGAGKKADGTVPAQAAIDLANIKARHQGDDYDLENDAVYLVNLRTGVPVPLDVGEGSYNYTFRDKDRYWANDPRRTEQNLLFETYDETPGDPGAKYEPRLDTDFDGVLDRPNLDRMDACPPPDLANPDDPERDRCLADHLMGWYERETDTLIARPIVPMDEMTEYAVVITDRVLDKDGNAVKSPLEFVHHPMQERGIRALQEHLRNPALASYYGDLGGTGLDHVAFAWTFTTQPTYDDLRRLRDGLYGTGPFGHLAAAFPPELELEPLVGLYTAKDVAEGEDPGSYKTATSCKALKSNLRIVHYDAIKDLLANVAEQALGLTGKELEATMEAFGKMQAEYLNFYNQVFTRSPVFFEGIADLLFALHHQDIKWGVVTNKPRRFAAPLLESIQLPTPMTCLVCGDDAPRPKPAPDTLLLACAQSAAKPEECFYVGDAARDIEAGNAAGMKTVVALYGYIDSTDEPMRWGADFLIKHPTDLMPLITIGA